MYIKVWEVDTSNPLALVNFFNEQSDRDMITVQTAVQLGAGKHYKIAINFTAILNDKMQGFYRSSYQENGVTKYNDALYGLSIVNRRFNELFSTWHKKITQVAGCNSGEGKFKPYCSKIEILTIILLKLLFQFESFGARESFPCFDEPSLKANFSVVLGRKDTFTSASNMPQTGTAEMYNFS